MVATRQDAWSADEDVLLSEVVLRHIREGGTQLSAFKEVGRHLSRTAAACGFRWNSYVRKLYKPGIDEAKRSRKERHGYMHEELPVEDAVGEVSVKSEFEGIGIDQVIEILQSIRDGTYAHKSVQQLQKENKQLYEEKNELIDRLAKLEEEYVSFFEYVDQKRSVVVLDAGDRFNRGKSLIEKVKK